jgi:hypothetical protein
MGLGLSVCYGIVHEHGGEVSAFNLHPHGAAVAVELPAADFAVKILQGWRGRGFTVQVFEDRRCCWWFLRRRTW